MGKLTLIFFIIIFTSSSLYSSENNYSFDQPEINKFLKDPLNRVDPLFKISSYFEKDVKFWFYVYTVFSSQHIILHDKENLALIYDVIEFKELNDNKALNKYTRFALRQRLTREKIKLIKKEFKYLQRNGPKNSIQKMIIKSLKKVGFRIPPFSKKRRVMFSNLSKNLRTQTGQRDSIQNGINSFHFYSNTFTEWLSSFDLPKELIWISFLESSFNVKAKSKVGATGVWQFMRRIGKHFMPYSKYKDGRLSPIMSTLSAFHLLHQNRKILRRWDLAVPAYNSGTKHIIKARRKLNLRAPSLEKILSSYDHPHLGFASKNFYSEFLALSHAQAYKKEFYNIPSAHKSKVKIDVYVSKCNFTKKKFVSLLRKSSPQIAVMNGHLRSNKKLYRRGTVLFSDVALTKKRYLKLTNKQLRKRYPKNFNVYLRGHNCSTK